MTTVPSVSPLRRGFVFAELLIAIIAIGMLVACVVILFDPLGQIQKTNDAKRRTDLSKIQKAVKAFYQDYGKYPPTSASPRYSIMSPGSDGADAVVTWGTSWTPYMGILPKDPSASRSYVYNTGPDRQSYYIYARLDKEVVGLSKLPADANCGSEAEVVTCNYGVSSPNVNP
jgi:hypothetical protein